MINRPKLPLHPFLFSIYPVLYMYAQNIVYIRFADTLRACGISLALGFFFLLSLQVILRDWRKSGLLTSLILILFYTFGHVTIALERFALQLNWAFQLSWLTALWALFFLVISYLILQSRHPGRYEHFLNLTSGVLFLFPLLSILTAQISTARVSPSDLQKLAQLRGEELIESTLGDPRPADLPDIYYIIFDGYIRDDKLEHFYNYDNTSFLHALEQRGFYISHKSRSNYMNTNYSLNTSLNLLYVHEFPKSIFLNSKYNLRTNHVSDTLRALGYRIVVYDSGSNDTNSQYADIFISPIGVRAEETKGVNPFEQILLRSTMALLLLERGPIEPGTEQASDVLTASVNAELGLRRERIEHAFDHLPDYARDERPHFLFAHIYLPHIPFLYGPGGEPLQYHQNLALYWFEVAPGNYEEYYVYQLEALNRMTLSTIDAILEHSTKPVVIVLQSDHGDEKFLDWDHPTAQGVDLRSAIFNAIYYSDESYESLYPTLTPVNTFRLIFNHWFDAQYPPLADRVFFHEHPLSTSRNAIPDFIDGCVHFDICLPDPQDYP